MSSKIALNCKTHFSLLLGFSKCDQLAKKAKELGYDAVLLADIGSMSGAVDFHAACRKHEIKPIIGCDFGTFILICKNKAGWFDLIKYVSDSSYDRLREVAEAGNLLCLTTSDGFAKLFGSNCVRYDYQKEACYYVNQSDAECHRVLLCSGMKTTIPKIKAKMRKDEEFDHKEFFLSDEYYLKPPKDNKIYDTILNQCEDFEVAHNPTLPAFECPKNMSQPDYLRHLCRVGWKERIANSGKVDDEEQKTIYADRVKHELDVILKADLSGYFLIVQDIVNEVKRRDWLAGPGRGSAAGCLVSYLIGITEVDPIEYGLIFERFYNEGRNTKDNISLPDIDVDVPAEHRDEIIDYIKEKYGHENVSQMVTFGRLQGRAALKEVLRINEAVSFAEMNEITKSIPNEAEISDQLEVSDDKSIINWALENDPEPLEGWCRKTKDGELEGPLADIFKQAINIEGTNKSHGKHAAGVIVSPTVLKDTCPMIMDKNNTPIAAFEMGDLEKLGLVKLDILGIDLLSKVMEIME